MALEISGRTKVLAGVVVLVGALGGAGFYFFDDIMAMIDPPPPPKAAAKAPASAPKGDAGKPAADAAKTGDAAKAPVADAAKAAEAPKGAEGAKPAAAPVADAKGAAKPKPIPTDPDKLIAEVIEVSGLKAQIQNFGREIGRNANAANQSGQQKVSDADARALHEVTARLFEPQTMTAEIHASLKAVFDPDRMTRFLEILRQPLAQKMAGYEGRQTPPEETTRLLEDIRKNPPSAQRQKVVQALDEITESSESGVQLATLTAREMIDAMFAELQKAGKQVPKEARQFAGSRIVASQGSMRSGFRTMYYITYRDASDEELAEYVKLLDTDVGRWGLQQLAAAQRAAVEARVRPFAKEVAQIAVKSALAKGKGAVPVAAPVEEEKPAEKLATAAPAPAPAAVEPPSYKRAPNTRELYSRYNDLITAAVMRDSAAVKELLEDGKFPDVRQKDGVTPLMIAAANNDVATANLLLAKGADPNLRAVGGRSALSLARERNSSAMIQLLQSKGAKE
jgi:hypothetical protein